MNIRSPHTDSTIDIARQELSDYLNRLSLDAPPSDITLNLEEPVTFSTDRYAISVDFLKGGGSILGSNPRSVLFGCYKLLKLMGIRWLRPGDDGVYIPETVDLSRPFVCASQAAYRHRGLCMEGAVSQKMVFDAIQWMMRLGFNAFFIQFREGYTFLERWYDHEENPARGTEHFTPERAAAITHDIRAEVKRRGLELQMVGHGWTCEPLGIPGLEWAPYTAPLPQGVQQFFAQVNGKRELWGEIPLNTHLCYSNPQVQELMTDSVIQYLKDNPDVDLLHFWLADGRNNHCECPECIKKRPADWYVDLLNLLDTKLTSIHSSAKIVFLTYLDLLWPPEQSRLAHPDRFIFMFAPITRSYSKPLTEGEAALLPPFTRNHLEFPPDPETNIRFLREWQKRCPTADSFDFDYHFMWDVYHDPGMYACVKTLYQDIRNLKSLGLNGLVSCQSTRMFFPSGLGMSILGHTLWNPNLTFEEQAEDYFRAAYGNGWQKVHAYFQSVSELFQPKLWRYEGTPDDRHAAAQKLDTYADLSANILPLIQQGLQHTNPCRRESWSLLDKHIELCKLIVCYLKADWGEHDERINLAKNIFAWARINEPRLQNVMDLNTFLYTYKHTFFDLINL